MKKALPLLGALAAIIFLFQNCSDGFQSALSDQGSSSSPGNLGDGEPPVDYSGLTNFLVNMEAAGTSDRFYSVNALAGGEILLAGQTEGFSATARKDAMIYVYNPINNTQSYHVIDPDPASDEQFFHMEETDPGIYLATGISRGMVFSGAIGPTYTNNGLLVEFNATTKTISRALVLGSVLNGVGWHDIIRGAHKIGTDTFLVGVQGLAYPRDNQWRPFIVRLDNMGQIVWARNINDDFNPRMTARLGNTIVVFGYHQDANGVRTGGVYRIDGAGRMLWHTESTSGGFWNGTVTANGEIIAAGQLAGNAVLVKLDSNGNILASRTLRATEADNFFGVEEMANGDIVASAHSKSTGSRDGLDDALVVRLSADFTDVQWARVYGVPGRNDRIENAHNISENEFGQIIVSGFSGIAGTDDADFAFSFSMNPDGTGLANCNLLQDVNLQMVDLAYTHQRNGTITTLPLNNNFSVQSLNIAQDTAVVQNANLLQRICQ